MRRVDDEIGWPQRLHDFWCHGGSRPPRRRRYGSCLATAAREAEARPQHDPAKPAEVFLSLGHQRLDRPFRLPGRHALRRRCRGHAGCLAPGRSFRAVDRWPPNGIAATSDAPRSARLELCASASFGALIEAIWSGSSSKGCPADRLRTETGGMRRRQPVRSDSSARRLRARHPPPPVCGGPSA